MLAAHYLVLRNLHLACVTLSGGLFLLRGVLHLADHPLVNRLWVRVLSWIIDTALLGLGVLLMIALRMYPPAEAWLSVKLLLLLVYIVLGFVALKRAALDRGFVHVESGPLVRSSYHAHEQADAYAAHTRA